MKRFIRRWWRTGHPAGWPGASADGATWDALGCIVLALVSGGIVLLLVLLFASFCRAARTPLPSHLIARDGPNAPEMTPDEDDPGGPSRATLDALRPFPPRAVARSWCRFQRAHGKHLEGLLLIRPAAPALEDAYDDLWCRYAAWHLLEGAHDPASSPAYRDECLAGLRDRIGASNFAAGRMPEPVDWGRFDRAD